MTNGKPAEFEWDAFISHASEDKEKFVRPLALALASLGAKLWYDEFSLQLGDSLSQSIDKGLARARFGIVVLSRSFMSKAWPQRELQGLVAREVGGHSRILPIWHEVGLLEVSDFSPTLADKVAVRTADATAIDIALQILNVVRPDLYEQYPRAHLMRVANGQALAELQEELVKLREQLSEFQCPYCKSQLTGSMDAPLDPEERHWDVVRTFECGYREFGGEKQQLCPRDPAFPAFDEYQLTFTETKVGNGLMWVCNALSSTKSARKVQLPHTFGATQDEAARLMRENYEQRAKPWLRPVGEAP